MEQKINVSNSRNAGFGQGRDTPINKKNGARQVKAQFVILGYSSS
jgi:hypothetical protein